MFGKWSDDPRRVYSMSKSSLWFLTLGEFTVQQMSPMAMLTQQICCHDGAAISPTDAGTMQRYPNHLAMHHKSITHTYPAFASASTSGLSFP